MYKRLARWALFFIFCISAFLIYHIKDLQFNYIFEDFFPTEDPDLAYYKKFKALFGEDNDYLLLSLKNESGVFDSTFLHKVDRIASSIDSLDAVNSTDALTNVKRPVISGAGLFYIPAIHLDEPHRYKQDSIQIFEQGLAVNSLISEDAKALAIAIRHKRLPKKENADEVVAEIQNIVDAQGIKEYHLAGKIYAQGVFISKMQYELLLFLTLSILLVMVFLAYAYRSLWGVIVPLVIVFLSTLWVLGFMAWTGKSIDILMALLPTIMFVVGMSDVVHIMTKYLEQLRNKVNKIKALQITFKEVGLATFLTSLTTGIGFLTLITASIRPINEFGIYTAVGVFMTFIVAFTVLPATLLFLQKPKIARNVNMRKGWHSILMRGFSFSLRHRNVMMLLTGLITILAIYGIFKIEINSYLIEDLPEDDPLKQDFAYFDQEFGGSRPYELTVAMKDSSSVFQPFALEQTQMIANYLRDSMDAGNVVSPVTVVKGIHQATNGGLISAFQLPETDREYKRTRRYLSRVLKQRDFNLVTPDYKVGRISARVGDIGSKISLEKSAQLKSFINANTDTSRISFKVTGTSNLIDKNNLYLAQNMFQGLAIAFGVVALIAGILFRSLRMILITLIPNIIPLLLVAGIMGLTGITLKLSTSIVFTIAFGIAVDDTIHFISKLRIELQKGKSLLYAIKRTYLSTGKAIVVTSIILSGGFLILLFSDFGGTFYTGLLISLTLAFAVLIDLTLLPVFVLLFFNKKSLHKFRKN